MGVADGKRVAVTPDERDVRQRAAELGGHALAGFDGEDVGAAGVQEGAGDPGAGADVHGCGAGQGTARQFLDGVEEGRWVGGPVGGVLGGGGIEGVGPGGVGGLRGGG